MFLRHSPFAAKLDISGRTAELLLMLSLPRPGFERGKEQRPENDKEGGAGSVCIDRTGNMEVLLARAFVQQGKL